MNGDFVPILMLTAKGDAMDRIIGLEIGADDYLPKPFEPRELVARVQTILRRQRVRPSPAPQAPPHAALLRFELRERRAKRLRARGVRFERDTEATQPTGLAVAKRVRQLLERLRRLGDGRERVLAGRARDAPELGAREL